MTLTCDCQDLAERTEAFLSGTLPPQEMQAVQRHLESCDACRDNVNCLRAVHGLLEYVQLPAQEAQQEKSATFLPSLADRFSAAPWWGVSALLHALVIALAGLISMAVSLPPTEDAVIMVTELAQRPKIAVEEEKKREPAKSALASKQETPPTDPTSKELNSIIVPPEILAKAELGDHFETINPDRPDTQSAFGNPDAQMFHSVQGNDEPEGGGGVGGDTLEDMIGVGGSGSPGSGGGWGGGNGTGMGAGSGSGRGSFGARNGGGRKFMVKKHGGNARTEDAVERALDWLARHQDADGHWIPKNHEGGTAEGTCETGSTGLALLAFLGAGHTEKVGKYKENVKRAVKWFIDNQSANGCYQCKSDPYGGRFYGHGIAVMAMSEAAGMANIPETKKSAQRGVDYVSEIQIKKDAEGYEREGWDYSYHIPGKVSDTSLTSWMMLGLKSAKVAGLTVDHRCFEGVVRWLDATQAKDPYKLGCWYRGTVAECLANGQPDNPRLNYNNQAAKENALVAANAVMRLYLGTPAHDPRIVTTAEHLVKNPPEYKQNKGMCYYHLYYGTLCMFQAGGEGWKKWNEGLKSALLPNQCKGGDEDGSWDPKADWLGNYGGRVYTTAMGCLCMEIYYRYAKLAQ